MMVTAPMPPPPPCKAPNMTDYSPCTGTDWAAASTPELVAHIVGRHHAFARRALDRLEDLLASAVRDQGSLPSPLGPVTVFFRELQQDLLAHFGMEEHNLFPAILAVAEGGPVPIALSTPRELLLTIEAEHRAVADLFLNIRMVTADYEVPPEAAESLGRLYQAFRELEDDLRRHLDLENQLLYPRLLPQSQA